ncbi:uncharacterized protein BDW70DRAFT_132570 [Aspergillus foveolatus]|uniref:uncharacterized protein n=1 Tax=Aspergillus foveolatus TaxID=210207 RepID=UPI003CCDFE85
MVSSLHSFAQEFCFPKMKRHWAPTAFDRRPVLMDKPFCGRPRKPRPLRLPSTTHALSMGVLLEANNKASLEKNCEP